MEMPLIRSHDSLSVNSIQYKTNGVAGKTRQSRFSKEHAFPEQGSIDEVKLCTLILSPFLE